MQTHIFQSGPSAIRAVSCREPGCLHQQLWKASFTQNAQMSVPCCWHCCLISITHLSNTFVWITWFYYRNKFVFLLPDIFLSSRKKGSPVFLSRTTKLNGELFLKRYGTSLTREKNTFFNSNSSWPFSLANVHTLHAYHMQSELQVHARAVQRYIHRCGKQFEWSLVEGVGQREPLSHQLLLLGPAFLHLHRSGPSWLLPGPLCTSPVGPSSSPDTVGN